MCPHKMLFLFYCFLLLCLQSWLIFQGLWQNLASWSIEQAPKFANSVATVKLLKTHFEGSSTYRQLASDNEKRWNTRVIFCRHVSPSSPSTGIKIFFLCLVKKKNNYLTLFCILENIYCLKRFFPICAAWFSLWFPVCCWDSLSYLVIELAFVELCVCRSGIDSLKALSIFCGNHHITGKGWGFTEPLVL